MAKTATLGLHETLTSHISLFFFALDPDQIRFLIIGAPFGLLLASVFTTRLHASFGKRNGLIAGILGMSSAVAVPIVLRLLGGAAYWPYGLEQIAGLAREKNIKLAVLPGDARPDDGLQAHSTLGAEDCERLWG